MILFAPPITPGGPHLFPELHFFGADLESGAMMGPAGVPDWPRSAKMAVHGRRATC